LEQQVATAQRQAQAYAAQIQALEQEAQHKQAENRTEVATVRQASRAATTPKQRERLLIQAERAAAQGQVQQARWQNRRERLLAHQRTWQQKRAERDSQRDKVAQALQSLEERPFYDFDLEKDDLMTYLRMAGENAHRLVQERYFAGTPLEKVDEATMVRMVYNQPGWVQRQGQYLHVLLQGYGDPEMQVAVAQACQRVNQAQIQLISGHRLRMEVAAEILDW
jgi:hypothetical protein